MAEVKYKCEIKGHYSQDIDFSNANLIPTGEQTPQESETFLAWTKKHRAHTESASKALCKAIEKEYAKIPLLDLSDCIAAREAIISTIEAEYAERKGFMEDELTDLDKLSAKMTLTNAVAGGSIQAVIAGVNTFLELTQLKEIAQERGEEYAVIDTIDSKLDELILPGYRRDIETQRVAIASLQKAQNDCNMDAISSMNQVTVRKINQSE